jgi:hypothetical protein
MKIAVGGWAAGSEVHRLVRTGRFLKPANFSSLRGKMARETY